MAVTPARDRVGALGWIAWLVFVVYGSLLPFNFQPVPLDQALLRWHEVKFLQLGIESRADWVANGVLYLPVGLLAARWLLAAMGGRLSALALALASLSGIALAFAVEFTQLYFPGRAVSQNDIVAECLGTLLGVAAAPFLVGWTRRLRQAWLGGGRGLGARLLELYAAGYVLLSQFPYDLLISGAEWHHKLNSEAWGLLLAGSSLHRGWLLPLLLGVELVLTVPIGVLLASRRPTRPVGVGLALAVGAGLGLVIEAGQFAIASGTSQGVSVLTRAAGVAIGVWGWRLWAGQGLAAPIAFWGRLAPVLALPYLALLLAVSGWFTHPLRDSAAVLLQWRALELMPLYYHYFTSEAAALFSLGSVVLMYLPAAAILGGWLGRGGAQLAGVALLASTVETGKLWLGGLHPDPTNVLIASAACWIANRVLGLVGRAPAAGDPPADALPADAAPPLHPGPDARRWAWWLTAPALALAAACALTLPWAAWPVTALLCGLGGLVWWRPVLALAIVPLALPVLDLAPWTGRFFWDEFDLLLLVLGAIGWQRSVAPGPGAPRAPRGVMLLLGLSLLLSAGRGLTPLQWPDLNSFINYHSPFNALRVAKGALWAAGFVALYRRLPQSAAAKHRVFACGMALGLLATVAQVLWERLAFPGLLDFASDYRVTGPISAMHTGGAYIECYLAIATAYLLGLLLRGGAGRWWVWLPGSVLLVASTYAMAVTFSRNGYAALAVVMVVMVVMAGAAACPPGAAPGPAPGWRRLLAPALLSLLMVAVAWPVLTGAFARQRLAGVEQDLATRIAHWRDALALRATDPLTVLLGEGLGRYPSAHYWRSGETLHAGSYALAGDAKSRWLRLGQGTSIYIEQWVDVQPGQRYRLSADVRSPGPAKLGLLLCQKWLLTSAACSRAEISVAASSGAWQHASVELDTTAWPAASGWARRPVKLALFQAGNAGTVEVGQVQLSSRDEQPLLRNGDFSAGLDHWFFSTDVDPPWHIHSTPVAVLFEQGWLGLLAWTALLLVALPAAARRAWRGDLLAASVLAALLAAAVCGALNTLTDAPRFLGLLLVLLWLAAAEPRSPSPSPGPGPGPGPQAG